MIYLVIGIYLFSLVYRFDLHNNQNGKKIHFYFSLLILTGLMAFRYRVGGDTLNYMGHFDRFGLEVLGEDLFSDQRWQPIPTLIFYACKILFDDFTYVQAIFAIFVNSVVFHFFKKYTKYYFTAIFLYSLTFYLRLNCEIMRESLAVSFFLLAYPYLSKRKLFYYYLFCSLALLCHVSSIFVFILPLLYSGSKKGRALSVVSVVVLLGGLFYVMLNTSIGNSLDSYSTHYYDYNSSLYGKINIIVLKILIPSFFLLVYKGPDIREIRFGVRMFVCISIMSLFFYISYRFNNYLIPIYLVYMSDLLNNAYRKRCNGHPKYIVYTFVFLFSFMVSYFSDVSKIAGREARWYCVWYPYYSIFNPQEDPARETFIATQFD